MPDSLSPLRPPQPFPRPLAGAAAASAGGEDALGLLDLQGGQLHEIFAAGVEDMAAATGFSLLAARSFLSAARPLFWLRSARTRQNFHRGRPLIPYAPGKTLLGIDPGQCLFVTTKDRLELLKAAIDATRCGGLGAVLIESWGNFPELGLTESRRLLLAARQSGVLLLSLRLAADPTPSAAQTRWRVSAGQSASPGARAPGLPAFHAELLRNRSGPAGQKLAVEWNGDRFRLRKTAVPGDLVSLSGGRALAGEPGRRAA